MDPASIIDAFTRFAQEFGIWPAMVCASVIGLLVRDYYQMRQRTAADQSIANVLAGTQRTTETLTKLLENHVPVMLALKDETKRTNTILEEVRSDLKRACILSPEQRERAIQMYMHHNEDATRHDAEAACDLWQKIREVKAEHEQNRAN